jgi:hypothetical protein
MTASGRPRPLPFALHVVIAFVALHAAKSAYATGVALAARAGADPGGTLLDALFPHVLYLSFDVLLALQILLRARSAIFWGVTYFATMAAFGLAMLVVEADRWPAISIAERARELGAIGAEILLAQLLLTRKARRALRR